MIDDINCYITITSGQACVYKYTWVDARHTKANEIAFSAKIYRKVHELYSK